MSGRWLRPGGCWWRSCPGPPSEGRGTVCLRSENISIKNLIKILKIFQVKYQTWKSSWQDANWVFTLVGLGDVEGGHAGGGRACRHQVDWKVTIQLIILDRFETIISCRFEWMKLTKEDSEHIYNLTTYYNIDQPPLLTLTVELGGGAVAQSWNAGVNWKPLAFCAR